MSGFLLPRYQTLAPYVPGEQPQDQTYIKLNTNESPHPPSPKVLEALNGERIRTLNLYPDPQAKALREAIGSEYGLSAENVFVGNGSDEVLALAFLAYADEDHPVVIPEISYGFYKVYAELFRVSPRIIALNKDFTIPVEKFCHTGAMVVLANPNAPTALALTLAEIERIVSANRSRMVLIDEAYVDFGGESAVSLLSQYHNLLIVRTFSKSRSLAGGRLGCALAGEAVIRDLERMKNAFNPYSVNSLTMAAGIAAIQDRAYFRFCVRDICMQREWAADQLKSLGFHMTESRTNFLFVSHPVLRGREYYERLKERGVLVRYLSGSVLENYVRVSVGKREQMEALVEATSHILREAGA